MIIKKIPQIFLFFIRFQLFFNPSTTETSLRFENLAEGDYCLSEYTSRAKTGDNARDPYEIDEVTSIFKLFCS